LRDVVTRELQNFTVKIKLSTTNETFEAWRERDHDDLVLAVALAAWVAEPPPNQHFVAPKPVEEPYHPRLHERAGGSTGGWPEDEWYRDHTVGDDGGGRGLWGRIFRRG